MDELRELFNDLNGKLISAINALDGSTLAGKLIKSYQVDYLSSALILAEADDNDQEHLAAIRYSIMPLAYEFFGLNRP